MAISYFPFDSISLENPDRAADSSQLAAYIATFISNGILATGDYALNQLIVRQTETASMQITVDTGACIINGRRYYQDTMRSLTVQAAEALDRIDRVILRLNLNQNYRNIDLYIIKGDAAAVPVAPVLTRNNIVYELAIAELYVPANVTTITQERITDTRLNTGLCGNVYSLLGEVDTSVIYERLEKAYDDYVQGFVADGSITYEKFASSVSEDLYSFKIAGGTGTAITLTDILMNDRYSYTFIVKAGNSGAATTINGEPLYKPGTTTSPNLVAGKAVTVWYHAAGNCFFIKASAEGDAVAGNVLAGKKFSNDDDTGITGTMADRGAPTQELNAGGFYNIPPGYYSGGVIAANSLASQTSGTATAGQILSGQTAWVNGTQRTGTMPNRGAVTPSALLGGASYTVPAGYHNGSGKVEAADLTIQTIATATAARIHSGYTAWVNGTRITGTAAVRYYATGEAHWNASHRLQFTCGFNPKFFQFTNYNRAISGAVFSCYRDAFDGTHCWWAVNGIYTHAQRQNDVQYSSGTVSVPRFMEGIMPLLHFDAIAMA